MSGNGRNFRVNIAGAGLAGLSSAITLAERGTECNLISVQPSERAQSVLAEGGMNAALDTAGEGDSPSFHCADTLRGGAFLADPAAVKGLTDAAPGIVRKLHALGVPFTMQGESIVLRPFGGQKKRRTAYAMSSTGKAVMTALIDEARKYEAAGLIHRYSDMEILDILAEDGRCSGLMALDSLSGEKYMFPGPVILCTGGMNGLFPGMTTGTAANTGNLTAALFARGVRLGNPEMLQYHPTTVQISGKRLLISEAARGEGGRLFIRRKCGADTEDWYFMEEKYPELKNLMPRDVISREMYLLSHDPSCESQVYLDMRHLSRETWNGKLSDLREEVIHYLKLDPAEEPVPVSPGIHFFMGGILTDVHHRTGFPGLWAAGECACQYHGANRLGGNSMLAAVYGGQVAALDVLTAIEASDKDFSEDSYRDDPGEASGERVFCGICSPDEEKEFRISPGLAAGIKDALVYSLGICRDEDTMKEGLRFLDGLENKAGHAAEKNRLLLARAMILSALSRKESRGAHYRTDHPDRDDKNFRKTSVCEYRDGRIIISYRDIPEPEGEDLS